MGEDATMVQGMVTQQALTGLILAGGKSTRFGSDKASAELGGRPMLQWVATALAPACDEIVIVRAAGQVLPAIEVAIPSTVVDDLWEAKGPLAGLASGLPAVTTEYCFATSCDAPLLQPGAVRHLARRAAGHDIVCVDVDGYRNPLVAVYRPEACTGPFRRAVERDVLKITAAFDGLDVLVVGEDEIRLVDPELLSFRNANRREALAEIERYVRAHPARRPP